MRAGDFLSAPVASQGRLKAVGPRLPVCTLKQAGAHSF